MVTTTSGAYITATNDSGNHTDDGETAIALPFPVDLYGVPVNTLYATSNGQLKTIPGTFSEYANSCLPDTATSVDMLIHPHWDDLRTDATGGGIFTDVLGLRTVWVPHSYPGCSQHAPNEHLPPGVLREGLKVMTGILSGSESNARPRHAGWTEVVDTALP